MMKNKLKIALLITIALLFSCKQNENDTIGHIECVDIIKPSNLKPIDWSGWNDAYTVGYTFYDNIENACHDYDGDTILCYGHIEKNLYFDYPSLEPEWIFLEGSEDQQDGQCVRILFSLDIMQNNIEKDALIRLLNSSSHSDTCFVKGVLGLGVWSMPPCQYVYPGIGVYRLEDIYFKH
jgi:hypothetical protein